jgi:tetratricopeptide (TPR) repeat protein
MSRTRSTKIIAIFLILAGSSILNPALSQDRGQKSETLPPANVSSGQGTANPRDPVLNFEYVWNRLDRNYGQFGTKHVDWDALYRTYRPQVTSATTGQELWDILLAMLGHLNDAHVCLADDTRRTCCGLTEGLKPGDFSLDLVKSKYLQDKALDALKGKFTYGWLTQAIGYVRVGDFKGELEPITQAIDSVIGQFAGARAVIVDVRDNPGGTGRAAELVAARFADRTRHYMRVQTRYGPKRDDLTPAEYRNVAPDGKVQFLGPTVLLTNRITASAADGFVLAMRVLPHVTVVGDLTEGALSAQFPDRLPNGWTLFVAFKVARDNNGVNWDGIGVPPDLRIVNTAADIAAGRDRVLEFALQLLEKGAPAPQDEADSLVNLKTSLVEAYVRCAGEKGVEAATTELNRARVAGGSAHYFSADEAMQQAVQYLGRKEYSAAIGLLQACQKDFPQFASTYVRLARAHLGAGDLAAAEAAMRMGERVEPMLPWEVPQIEQMKIAILKQKQGSAAAILGKALADGGLAAAEKALVQLTSRREKDGPVFDEADFNALGYRLLQENSLEFALYVFTKNVQLYPGSSNAYDSLGEAFVKAGRKAEAIESYRRSLALNPGNANARSKLKDLEKRP